MWKLAVFGYTDANQVLHKVAECRKAYPSCYIRLAAFDSVKQVQIPLSPYQRRWNPIDNKKYETFL